MKPIVLTAFLLRVAFAFLLLGDMPLLHDAASYWEAANTFLSTWKEGGSFYWPVGMPLVLLVPRMVTGAPWLAKGVSVVLSTASVPLVMALATKLGNGPRAGRVAGWIMALYPPSVLLSGQPYAQHLAFLCMLGFVYALGLLFERRGVGLAALVGALWGFGALVRPSMLSLGLLLVPFVMRRGRVGGRHALVVGVVALACTAPVLVHHAEAGAGWVLSTNNERNFFLGNNPHTHPYKTSHLGQRPLSDLPPDVQAYLRSFYERPDARKAMQAEALRTIRENPMAFVRRTANRITSFWGFDYLGARLVMEHRELSLAKGLPLLGLEAAGYLAVLLVGGLSLIVLSGQSPWRLLTGMGAFAYALPYAIAFSGGTYHFPVMGGLVAAAGVSLSNFPALVQGVRARPWRALFYVAGVLIIQGQYAYYTFLLR